MRTPPVEGWEPTKIKYSVAIPTRDGKAVARTVDIEVDGWRDADGETFLDGDAEEKIEAIKARHMGLLAPAELKQLRESLGATQKELSELLQLGEKTWTRWESGRERPSRSLNLLLCALRDGKIDLGYLSALRLGHSLATLWLDEAAALTHRPFQYKTTRRQDPLQSVSPSRHTHVYLDSCFLAHLSWATELVPPHEMPWSEAQPPQITLGGTRQTSGDEPEPTDTELAA